jgi:hypothetical protein
MADSVIFENVISRNAKILAIAGTFANGHVAAFTFHPHPRMVTTILALDLARVAGAAWRPTTGAATAPVTRAFVLGGDTDKREENSSRCFDLVGALLDEVGPDLLVMEDDTGQHPAVTRTLRAYQTVAALAATRRGIPVSIELCASRVRATALGFWGLPKDLVLRLARDVYDLTGSDDEVDAGLSLIAAEMLTARGEAFKAPRNLRRKSSREAHRQRIRRPTTRMVAYDAKVTPPSADPAVPANDDGAKLKAEPFRLGASVLDREVVKFRMENRRLKATLEDAHKAALDEA